MTANRTNPAFGGSNGVSHPSHLAAERNLLGLVDNPHPTATDLPENLVVAQGAMGELGRFACCWGLRQSGVGLRVAQFRQHLDAVLSNDSR